MEFAKSPDWLSRSGIEHEKPEDIMLAEFVWDFPVRRHWPSDESGSREVEFVLACQDRSTAILVGRQRGAESAGRSPLFTSLANGRIRICADSYSLSRAIAKYLAYHVGCERPGAGPTGQLMRGGTTRTIVEPLVELPSASVAVNVTSVSPHG